MTLRATLMGATLAGLLLGAAPAFAQDRAQSLADIRQELSVLYVQIQQLRTELSTTGGAQGIVNAGPVTDRLNALESRLTQLTAQTEALEGRVNAVVRDGTNRIGDLEFRLVELEGGDISQLGETTTLGGGDMPVAGTPGATGFGAPAGGSTMAVAEQSDFDAAMSAFSSSSWAEASDRFGQFLDAYPGSPLSADAGYMRGEALAKQGQVAEAARAYLAAYQAAPQGTKAAEALLKLGAALGELGQVSEACATLGEVANRFPGSDAVALASQARAALQCQ